MNARILLVAGDYPPARTGIADYSRRLAAALVQQGMRVTVVTTASEEGEAEAVEEGVRVLRTMPGWRLRDLPRLLRIVDEAGRGTVVHIQYPAVSFRRNPMINLLPELLRRFRPHCPVVVTVHDARVMRRRWRARIAPMLAAARAVIHVDPPDAAYLERWTWGNTPVRACIPIGSAFDPVPVSAALRESWREELGLPGPEPVIAFFGILYPHKGLPELMAAVELLRARGTGPRLLVIGDFDRPTPFAEQLTRQLREGRSGGWLVWLRGADEVQVSRALWSADAAALPFHSGAASNRSSLLATLAHRVPTVTTRGPATPVDFERTYPVSLVPVRDVEALASALAATLESRQVLRDEIGTRLDTLFPSWEAVARQHVAVYSRLLARREAA